MEPSHMTHRTISVDLINRVLKAASPIKSWFTKKSSTYTKLRLAESSWQAFFTGVIPVQEKLEWSGEVSRRGLFSLG